VSARSVDGVATVGDLMAWLTHRGEGYAYAFENPNIVRSAIDKRHVRTDARITGITMAQPAPQREKSRKTPPSSDPKIGLTAFNPGLSSSLDESRGLRHEQSTAVA
jgi:hypothetical protein